MKRALALSTFAAADTAANDALTAGGSAVKAVVTGFFAAAGTSPGVLFSPVSILVAGLGAGARAYDGRARQPGKEAKRPRGFLPDDEIPLAARVAIPGSLSALALACAYDGNTTLLSCSRPGVALAKSAGAKGRAELIDLTAGLGSAALSHQALKRAFLGAYGPAEGGVVSAADLAAPEAIDGPALTLPEAFLVPDADRAAPEDAPLGEGHVLIAADVNGVFAALAFRELSTAAMLDPFEVALPLLGAPVLRGVARLGPGSAIGTPSFLEVRRDGAGRSISVVAKPRENAPTFELLRDLASKELTPIAPRT